MTNETENNKYELWSSATEGSKTFCPADNNSVKAILAPDAKLICVIEATSWNEAQQKYCDLMGWGNYKSFEEGE